MGNQNSHNEATSAEGNMTVPEAKQKVMEYVAEPDSEEGQEVIHNDSTHVLECWEDGELTSTKSGDLYRRRNLHQSHPPIVESAELLWEVESGDHKRMVVTDRLGLKRLLLSLSKTINGDDGSWYNEQLRRDIERMEEAEQED